MNKKGLGLGLLVVFYATSILAVNISGTIRNPVGGALGGPSSVRTSHGGGTNYTTTGSYTVTVPSGWTGYLLVERVESSGDYAAFSPSHRAYTNVTGNLSNQDFQILPSTPYTISGFVTNSAGAGQTNVLLVATTNGGAALTWPDGHYNLGYHPQGPNWSGTVTPHRADTTFTPASRSYSSIASRQTNQHYLVGGGGGGTEDPRTNLSGTACNQIAFMSDRDGGDWDVYISDLNGATQVNLTADSYDDMNPHFRYDGARILFDSSRGGTSHLYSISANGTGLVCLTVGFTNAPQRGKWSWDGSSIVFQGGSMGNGNIYTMNATGGNFVAIMVDTNDDEWPSWSPDGQWITFQRKTGSMVSKLYRVRPNGSDLTALTDGSDLDEMPYYSPDGQYLIFKRGTATPDIYRINASDGSGLTNITSSGSDAEDAPVYSYEGTKLAFQSATGSPTTSEIYWMIVGQTNRYRVTNNSAKDWNPTFSPAAGQVSLSLAKSSDAQSVTGGQAIAFVLVLTNQSALAASNAVVKDTLGALLVCLTNTISGGGAWEEGTKTITWALGIFDGGASTSLTFSATVSTTVTFGAAITNKGIFISDQTGTNTGNAVVLRVPLAVKTTRRFGAGGLNNATNYALRTALGITYARLAVSLTPSQCANPDSITFTGADSIVTNSQAHGLRLFGVCDLQVTNSTQWPAATNFARAFRRYVERYDGDGVDDMPGLAEAVHHWEIFNEFQLQTSLWAGCTTEMYGGYLSNAWAVGHAADPHITIVASSVAGDPAEYGRWYLTELLTNAWAAHCIDAFNYHAYRDFSWHTNATPARPQYLAALYFMDFLKARGLTNQEIWATETDFCFTYMDNKAAGITNSQTENAMFLARSYPFALAAGFDHLLFTELEYDAKFPPHLNWAVMTDSGGNRRMNFYVYQKMIEMLEDFQRASLPSLGGAHIGCLFARANGPVWVVWNYSNLTSQVVVPIGPVSEARITQALPSSFDNNSATWAVTTNSVTHGYVTVNTSSNSVYIEPIGAFDDDLDGDGMPNDQDNDIDGDGMPNDFEYAYSLNPFFNDATLDADEDGAHNGEECAAGTNPRNSNSVFRVNNTSAAGADAFVLRWQSATGRSYAVHFAGWLVPGATWTNEPDGTNIVGDGTTKSYTNAISGVTNRFYRLRVWPTP